MSLIENLAVGLTVQTNQFASKLRGAAKSVQGFASSIGGFATGATARLAGLAAAITGVGSVAALAHFTHQAMEAIDVNAKLADRINSTTEGLISLQHAANLAGSSGEELNAALDRLQKGIGGGSKTVVAALEAIGLTLKDVRGKGGVEQFKMVASGIKNLTDVEQRAFVITQLYGKSGQSLTATIMDVGDATKYSEEWTRKLGLAYSRLDAFKVEEANDAITDLSTLLKGVFTQIGIQISPVVTAVAEGITGWGTSGEGAASLVSTAFNTTLDVVSNLVDMIDDAAKSMMRFAAVALRTIDAINIFSENPETVANLGLEDNSLIKLAKELEAGIGAKMSSRDLHGSLGNRLRDFVGNAQQNAADEAFGKQREADAEKAKRQKIEGYLDTFGDAMKTVAPLFKFFINSSGKSAGDLKAEAAWQSAFQSQLGSALDPRNGLFDEAFMRPNTSLESASAGTRGTFAADTASRMSPSYSVQEKQLEVQKSVLGELRELNDNFLDGPPIG